MRRQRGANRPDAENILWAILEVQEVSYIPPGPGSHSSETQASESELKTPPNVNTRVLFKINMCHKSWKVDLSGI